MFSRATKKVRTYAKIYFWCNMEPFFVCNSCRDVQLGSSVWLVACALLYLIVIILIISQLICFLKIVCERLKKCVF